MKYAKRCCKITVDGEMVKIDGPYVDQPNKRRTISVFKDDYDKYESGAVKYVQNAFPYLSADDREFLISGISPEKWNEMFPDE